MRNAILAIAAVALIISGVIIVGLKVDQRFDVLECLAELNRCTSECDETRDRAINETIGRLMTIGLELSALAIDCRGADTAECRARINELVQERNRLLDIQSAAEAQYQVCASQCNWDCYKPLVVGRPFDLGCIGPSCFREVLEICTVISGPCAECGTSLCGGGEWAFESEVPLNVTLVAATDPLKNPRVIATSSLNGKQAVLSVPANIKLDRKEQLYFGFDSQQKPSGPIKVLIHRIR